MLARVCRVVCSTCFLTLAFSGKVRCIAMEAGLSCLSEPGLSVSHRETQQSQGVEETSRPSVLTLFTVRFFFLALVLFGSVWTNV